MYQSKKNLNLLPTENLSWNDMLEQSKLASNKKAIPALTRRPSLTQSQEIAHTMGSSFDSNLAKEKKRSGSLTRSTPPLASLPKETPPLLHAELNDLDVLKKTVLRMEQDQQRLNRENQHLRESLVTLEQSTKPIIKEHKETKLEMSKQQEEEKLIKSSLQTERFYNDVYTKINGLFTAYVTFCSNLVDPSKDTNGVLIDLAGKISGMFTLGLTSLAADGVNQLNSYFKVEAIKEIVKVHMKKGAQREKLAHSIAYQLTWSYQEQIKKLAMYGVDEFADFCKAKILSALHEGEIHANSKAAIDSQLLESVALPPLKEKQNALFDLIISFFDRKPHLATIDPKAKKWTARGIAHHTPAITEQGEEFVGTLKSKGGRGCCHQPKYGKRYVTQELKTKLQDRDLKANANPEETTVQRISLQPEAKKDPRKLSKTTNVTTNSLTTQNVNQVSPVDTRVRSRSVPSRGHRRFSLTEQSTLSAFANSNAKSILSMSAPRPSSAASVAKPRMQQHVENTTTRSCSSSSSALMNDKKLSAIVPTFFAHKRNGSESSQSSHRRSNSNTSLTNTPASTASTNGDSQQHPRSVAYLVRSDSKGSGLEKAQLIHNNNNQNNNGSNSTAKPVLDMNMRRREQKNTVGNSQLAQQHNKSTTNHAIAPIFTHNKMTAVVTKGVHNRKGSGSSAALYNSKITSSVDYTDTASLLNKGSKKSSGSLNGNGSRRNSISNSVADTNKKPLRLR